MERQEMLKWKKAAWQKLPTGKMATMKIASPSASAQMPRQHQFLPHMAAPPSRHA